MHYLAKYFGWQESLLLLWAKLVICMHPHLSPTPAALRFLKEMQERVLLAKSF